MKQTGKLKTAVFLSEFHSYILNLKVLRPSFTHLKPNYAFSSQITILHREVHFPHGQKSFYLDREVLSQFIIMNLSHTT